MMSTFFALLSFLLATSAYPTNNDSSVAPSDSTNTVARRWYSVPEMRVTTGPWPVKSFDPVTGNHAPIVYCYEDAWEIGNFPPLVGQAFSKWRDALDQSALDFVPDPSCYGILECGCATSLTQPDTLHIIRSTDGQTKAVVGYEYDSNRDGRHTLKIGGYDPKNQESVPLYVLAIAHELGHVAGLAHEHQRPDRDIDLRFDCSALVGYTEGITKVSRAMFEDVNNIPECRHLTPEKCMLQVVCQSEHYVDTYMPNAFEYVTGDQVPTWDDFETELFDPKSIMIYSSYKGSNNPTGQFPTGAVLVGLNGDEKFQIYTGGDADPAAAGISDGDTERIKELYPKGI
ncbi:hypothetical protein LTR10_008049 [Elasticomyces elasticus]|nr:hypothetical protein LTR10_008049 [Elasticomyces elasticus]KAK4971047.1 hypothetical protein LTR42_008026 [Elasticomyces elasticus]